MKKIELRDISTKVLIDELMLREEIRSMEILKDEAYRVQAANINGSKERYLRGRGAVKILEIKI